MSIPYARVIVNPAGAYFTHRQWSRIDKLLWHVGLAFDFEYTEGVGHAIELARAATGDGCQHLVAVGEDGTVNEVANGILRSTGSGSVMLGIVNTGTGSDFIRSAGIPRHYSDACSFLTSQRWLVIVVGVVQFRRNGETLQRYFVNAAGVGFDATVAQTTEKLPKFFGGTIPYLVGLVRILFSYRNKPVVLNIENEVETGRVLNVAVANGGYLGGGIHIAPEAKLDDSLLDVVIVGDIGKFELLKALPTVYQGTHVDHPKVSMRKARRVSVESPERILVYADGELLGEGPASFSLLPSALSVVV
ncbi:diacylglycerol/lipid kinase family protein [Chloroflexota bacterium]